MSDAPSYDPDAYNFFGFMPSLAAGVAFVTLFGILFLVNLYLGIKSKLWWVLANHTLGTGGEVAGWAGRLKGHFNPFGLSAYLTQQICLAISPTCFSAACYIIFGHVLKAVDPNLSYIRPSRYFVYFILIDISCLILQGIGGGMSGSSAATGSDNLEVGQNIYLAGVVWQLFNMLAFTAFVVDYFWRLVRIPDWREKYSVLQTCEMKSILGGLALADVLILLRNAFRSVELGQGFSGQLATDEPFFNCLDALPMLLCVIALTTSHPVFTLQRLPNINLSVFEKIPSKDSETSVV